MKSTSSAQEKLYCFIETKYAITGQGPSYSEMRQHMGVASNEAIASWLNILEREGYLKRIPGKKRGIVPLQDEVQPFVGVYPAAPGMSFGISLMNNASSPASTLGQVVPRASNAEGKKGGYWDGTN